MNTKFIKMGDTNVQTSGVGAGAGHHIQLHHHHQLHHHASSGSGTGTVSTGHHSDAAQLSFGLGFFPDPSDMSSKSLPPFSSFGEADGLMGEGLSGRLLDLGGVGNGGGPPPWDLYGEGLSARLIDVGAPTPLGLGIGVGVGLGLGFAPPPPSAVPARDHQGAGGAPQGLNGTGPGGVQYRPWESKNGGVDGPNGGNPPTLLELGRMMAVSPPPSSGSFTELQLLPPPPPGSPKLPSFQSQFQHSYTSSPSPTAIPSAVVAGSVVTQGQPTAPSNDPSNGFLHHHNNNNNSSNNNNVAFINGVRYPVVPAPVHPHARQEGGNGAIVTPQPPSGHPGAFVHHAFPATTNHHYASLPVADPVSGYQQQQQHQQHQHLHMVQQQRHQNGSSPAIKLEMDDSRSPFSSQSSLPVSLRPQTDGRKKEKRKYRASSLESSGSDASDAQVPSVSSTARGFKHPTIAMTPSNGGPGSVDSGDLSCGEKQSKKKRKRCGECIGCMRKDNCASCAPCRNDKSHQICKMRRCEKLTEKKIKVSYLTSSPSAPSPTSPSPSSSIEVSEQSSEQSSEQVPAKRLKSCSRTILPNMY